ncbi:unnamed protein product, partial [Laminaria digitata]
GNVVRLAPEDESSPIRTFYLRLPSKQEAEEWADSIRGTRFVCVREERDALRSAKTALTEQIATLAETLRNSRGSLEASHRRETAAVSELERSNAKEARCAALVRALAASACDADDGEQGQRTDSSRAGGRWGSDPHLVKPIDAESGGGVNLGAAVCALSELAALEEAISERTREIAALKRANEALRESASAEAEHRRQHEAAALTLRRQEHERVAGEAAARKEVEAELQALRAELEGSRAGREEARANLGAVAAACREAEAKARELQEHRRVLAREVKASRVEQRRLSAALACATRAATAAAATAAAATATAAGDRCRSSSLVGSVAGDGACKAQVARGGVEGEGGGIGGGGGGGERGGGGGKESESENELYDKNETEKAEVLGLTPTRDAVKSGKVDDSSSISADATRPPVFAGADLEGDLLPSSSPPSRKLRPPSLDLLRAPSGGVGGESGATSPEAGSPGLLEGGGRRGSGGSCGSGGRRRESEWSPSPSPRSFNTAAAYSPAGTGGGASGSVGAEASGWLNVAVSGGGGGNGTEGHGCGVTGRAEIIEEDEALALDRRSLCLGADVETGVGAGVGAGRGRGRLESADRALPMVGSPSETGLVGESSRFVNQMVQTFSAGLRESRRARRTPLLGSLDDGSNHGDAATEVKEEEEEEEDDDGGVTDGCVTDGVDGDSRHFAAPEEEEREEDEEEEEEDEDEGRGGGGAWSAWSTV